MRSVLVLVEPEVPETEGFGAELETLDFFGVGLRGEGKGELVGKGGGNGRRKRTNGPAGLGVDGDLVVEGLLGGHALVLFVVVEGER